MKSSAKQAKSSRKIETAKAIEPSRKLVWWHWFLAAAAVVFVAFEVYSPALNGEFLFDDSYLPFLMPNVAEGPLRGWLGVRPLLMITYWLNYKISGLTPFPYHAVSVLFHAVNAMLAGLIVRRLLGWAGETGWTREALSVFAGALFLLHPVQTESVAYVSSRSEAMSVMFFLAAFAVFVYRDAIALSVGRIVAVILLFVAACGVKEHTAVLPALLLLTDYYFITPFQLTAIRRNLKLYVPIAVAGALGLIAVISVLQTATTAGFKIKEFTWYEYLFTQFRVIWLYLRLYVAPFGQNADYEFPISHSILDVGSLLGLIGSGRSGGSRLALPSGVSARILRVLRISFTVGADIILRADPRRCRRAPALLALHLPVVDHRGSAPAMEDFANGDGRRLGGSLRRCRNSDVSTKRRVE